MAVINLYIVRNIGKAIILIATLIITISPVHAAPTTTHNFIVDNPWADNHDSNPGDHICSNGAGGCTLRAAVEEANATNFAHPGDQVNITFNETGASWPIYLSLGALQINEPNITIDGESRNPIVIGGGGELVNGFEISNQNITIRNLTIRGQGHYGIYITGYYLDGISMNVLIEGVKLIHDWDVAIMISNLYFANYIWEDTITVRNALIGTTSASSTACVTSDPDEGNVIGIMVLDNVRNVTIETSNVVCNSGAGIGIAGWSVTPENTIIRNSFIGTNGTTDMGNGLSGIEVISTSYAQIRNNVISGNNEYGVMLNYADGTILTGNKIGMNAAGTAAVGNTWEGIAITNGSFSNTIGGFTLADRNWIGGNGASGVLITDSTTHFNVVAANYIGMGPSVAIPNGYAGIAVLGGYVNIIGVASTSVPQVISCNTREGIYIQNAISTAVLDSNLIGVSENGNLPRGNGREGIKIVDSTDSSISPSRVSFNGDLDVYAGAGIAVIGSGAWRNLIRPGQIDRNSQLPIDLGNDGSTANGSHSDLNGPNQWLPYPQVTSRNGQTINGTTCAYCRVDIYSAYQDPGAAVGGGTWIQYVNADDQGIFQATLPNGVGFVTMTATDSQSNTSEMTPIQAANPAKAYLPLLIR